MAVLIGHAVSDENGSIDKSGQALVGDQTGKEICTRHFYVRTGGWHTYLQPIDIGKGMAAAKILKEICDDDHYGYSQSKRWTGYKAIQENGGKVAGASGSFDCSSLVTTALIEAGFNLKPTGYTGNLVKLLMASGEFTKHTDKEYLTDDQHALPGGVWVGDGHTCMALEAGSGSPTPINSPYVEVIGGSVIIRAGAGKEYPKLTTAHKGDRLPYLETDEDTGWYWVESSKGAGAITNKPKYTKLVL